METRLGVEAIIQPADLSEAVHLSHQDIAEAIKGHWEISRLFDVGYALNSNNVVVSLTAKEPGELSCPEINFEWSNGNNYNWVAVNGYMGGAKDCKDGYRIIAEYEAAIGGDIKRTEPQYFDPDNNDKAYIRTDILQGLFPEETTPSVAQLITAPQYLNNSVLEYKLNLTDYYNGTSHHTVQSGSMFMLNGELEHSHYLQGIADWKKRHSSTLADSIWVIGEDDQSVERVRRSQPQYIYLLYARPSQYSITVWVQINRYDTTGGWIGSGGHFTLTGGQMVRLAVGPDAIGANDNTQRYLVSLQTAQIAVDQQIFFAKNYELFPDLYNDNLLLLQTKYGTHKTFPIRSVSYQNNSNNTVYCNSDSYFVDITEKYETYTAHTGSIRKKEAAAINEALMNERHYIYAHGDWQRIIIVPDTMTIVSDDDDMQDLSFNFRFCNKQYNQRLK